MQAAVHASFSGPCDDPGVATLDPLPAPDVALTSVPAVEAASILLIVLATRRESYIPKCETEAECCKGGTLCEKVGCVGVCVPEADRCGAGWW